MRLKKFQIFSATTCLVMTANFAHAGSDVFNPSFQGGLVLEWQNEYRADSDDANTDETNNSFLRGEFVPVVNINDNLYFDGVLVFEPMDQAETLNAGDSILFDRNGAFFEELKLNYTYDNLSFLAGKFNPAFGTAWNAGRGIWSEDFAEDYEVAEKVGAAASYEMDLGKAGTHTASLAVFKSDRSFLTDAVITSRPRATLADGGASNTNDFGSYTFALNGENIADVENLTYHIAYRSLAEQDDSQSATTARETGSVAGLTYVVPVNDDLSFDLLGEIVDISNFEGVTDANRQYYTGSIKANFYQNWNTTLGYTLRDIDEDGTATDYDDHLLQLTGGYDFQNGFTAEGGLRSSEEANEDTKILGFLVRYAKEF